VLLEFWRDRLRRFAVELIVRRRHGPNGAAEPRGDRACNGERSGGFDRAVHAYDHRPRPRLGVAGWPRDQHRAGRVAEHPRGDRAEQKRCRAPASVRPHGDQRRALGLSLTEHDRDRVAVEKLGARRGRDRLRLGQGRLGLVLQEFGRVGRRHPSVRCLREVRNRQEEDAPALGMEMQPLPDCDQARGRAVDAAEDAVEELSLARLWVHPRRLGCRSRVDVLRPEERTHVALESRERLLHAHLCSIASP
jgi:hypothetical protein